MKHAYGIENGGGCFINLGLISLFDLVDPLREENPWRRFVRVALISYNRLQQLPLCSCNDCHIIQPYSKEWTCTTGPWVLTKPLWSWRNCKRWCLDGVIWVVDEVDLVEKGPGWQRFCLVIRCMLFWWETLLELQLLNWSYVIGTCLSSCPGSSLWLSVQ